MMHRTVRFLVVTAALLSTVVQAEQKSAQLHDDDIVARVNGTPIYRKSVREVVQGSLAVQDKQPDAAAIGKLAADALDSIIAFELLYQESQTRGITVDDKAVDEEIARTKSAFPDSHAFDAAMKAKGMTMVDLRRDTRKTMAVNRLLEGQIWKDLRVTADQIKDFYEQNKQEFKHPPQIRASHILIRLPEHAAPAERQAAKKRAADVLDKIKAGGDFAQLAREYSDDAGSKSLGGDLGFFAKGEMVEAFEKEAFKLAPGQVSGIVETPYGFDIIKVTAGRDAGYESLEDVQDRIREVLNKSARQQRQADFVAELRKKTKVELTEDGR